MGAADALAEQHVLIALARFLAIWPPLGGWFAPRRMPSHAPAIRRPLRFARRQSSAIPFATRESRRKTNGEHCHDHPALRRGGSGQGHRRRATAKASRRPLAPLPGDRCGEVDSDGLGSVGARDGPRLAGDTGT